MIVKTEAPGGEVVVLTNVDCEKLATLPADERELIVRVLRHGPKFTAEKAIEVLRAFKSIACSASSQYRTKSEFR